MLPWRLTKLQHRRFSVRHGRNYWAVLLQRNPSLPLPPHEVLQHIVIQAGNSIWELHVWNSTPRPPYTSYNYIKHVKTLSLLSGNIVLTIHERFNIQVTQNMRDVLFKNTCTYHVLALLHHYLVSLSLYCTFTTFCVWCAYFSKDTHVIFSV